MPLTYVDPELGYIPPEGEGPYIPEPPPTPEERRADYERYLAEYDPTNPYDFRNLNPEAPAYDPERRAEVTQMDIGIIPAGLPQPTLAPQEDAALSDTALSWTPGPAPPSTAPVEEFVAYQQTGTPAEEYFSGSGADNLGEIIKEVIQVLWRPVLISGIGGI